MCVIFGPTKESQIWRVKTNEEQDELIKHKNIVSYIKAQRLSWFGHVQRMSDTRTAKKIFNWKPLTKRTQGRPKYRWEDNIKQDFCQMKIKNWTACVQDREKWKKEVVEKAKTFSNERKFSTQKKKKKKKKNVRNKILSVFILRVCLVFVVDRTRNNAYSEPFPSLFCR